MTPFVVSVALCAGLALAEPGEGTRRAKDVGIVSYRKFQRDKAEIRFKRRILPLFSRMKALGLEPAWVSVDIFLPRHKEERDRFKRIFIPSDALTFSPAMYEGMTDYVRSGGLLISNSALLGIDRNADYRLDVKSGDAMFYKRRPFETLGVHAHSTAYSAKIKSIVECPLTNGMPVGEERELGGKHYMRCTTNVSATMVVAADLSYKEKRLFRRRPVVCLKHQDRGACIYISPSVLSGRGDIPLLFRNALSAETLEWLTAGEEEVK